MTGGYVVEETWDGSGGGVGGGLVMWIIVSR